MSMVETLDRRGSDTPPGAAVRQVGRRRALPNGRAILGALLITASVFGVFWSWSLSSRPPSTAYVAAARDLVVGETLAAGDLRLVTAELPAELARSSAFTDPETLVGATVVGPVRRGELVQAGSVAKALGGPGLREMAFQIESSRALAGRLSPGQRVDVLATFGAGGDTYTTAVVRRGLVLRIERETGALGSRSGLVITLGLEAGQDPLALAHALNVGDVYLVRSAAAASATDAGPEVAPGEQVYRAPDARREPAR